MAEPVTLPTIVQVASGSQPLRGTPEIPGSKYAMVRAGLAAALATGTSTITHVPWTDDTHILFAALKSLGITTAPIGPETIRMVGCGGRFPIAQPVRIDAGNAGAVLRLLLGVGATLPEVRFTTPFPDSLGRRPNRDLLDALRQLGVGIPEAGPDGTLPITLRREDLHGGAVSVSGARGSQYLSALLYLAPLIGEVVEIAVIDGLRSAGFVRLTLTMLRQAGIAIDAAPDLRSFRITGDQHFQPRDWRLARDWPTAGMWLMGAALTDGTIALTDLDPAAEDGIALTNALRAFGVPLRLTAAQTATGLVNATIVGPAALCGTELDGEPVLDSVPTLAALASCGTGKTVFRNVGALRLKESDRIGVLCEALNRAGAQAQPGENTITIIGQPDGIAGGVVVDAHHDHRLAMALALLALRCRAPLTITGADHVAKSYPRFWDELGRLGATVVNLSKKPD